MLRLFLNRCSVYVALLHMRNAGSSGAWQKTVVLAGSSLSEFQGSCLVAGAFSLVVMFGLL